jgi:nucleotide-binding universal stress UspA family protein
VSAVSSFNRVLVGFDGSPDAAEALRVGARIANRACRSGQLVVLCVLLRALPPAGNHAGGDGAAVRAQAEATLRELAAGTRPASRARTSVEVVYSGGDSPGNIVTSYAEEHDFDLLALGRHGHGGRRKSVLGRVADRAARACPVPVLLVSAPQPSLPPGRHAVLRRHAAGTAVS